MKVDLQKENIKTLSEKIKAGEVTSRQIVESCLEKIEKKDANIHAYLEVFNDALQKADEIDDRLKNNKPTSPLAGIPLAIKDNILISGKTASASSKILENYKATYDSTAIERLKNAGAIFLGRANMDEFAMGSSTQTSAYGVTRNPLDETKVPGGSSGGSAAAVAAGMALGALGSDTAGSVRQPASFCGIVGLKPTYGSVSRHGLIALGSSLDVIGPMTKTVTDSEIIFDTLKGFDPMDSNSIPNDQFSRGTYETKKIGVLRDLMESDGIDESVRINFKESLDRLVSLGYEIVEVSLPHVRHSLAVYYTILPAEASTNLARFDGIKYGLSKESSNLLEVYKNSRGEGFGPEVKRRILVGTYVLSAGYYDAYYGKATEVRRRITKDFDEAFKQVDLIVTPTAPTTAFGIGEKMDNPIQMYLADVFTVPANLAGIPALSLPSGFDTTKEKSLPIGIQFTAPRLEERRLFDVGKKFLGE